MAARTSASATKSTGLGEGEGFGTAGDAVSGASAGDPTGQDATAPEPVSQPNSVLGAETPRRARKQSTTWAETLGATEDETTAGAGAFRDARYRSTIFETKKET